MYIITLNIWTNPTLMSRSKRSNNLSADMRNLNHRAERNSTNDSNQYSDITCTIYIFATHRSCLLAAASCVEFEEAYIAIFNNVLLSLLAVLALCLDFRLRSQRH
jgi:hypothetical protein